MPKSYLNFNVDLFDYRKQDGMESCRVKSHSREGEVRLSDAPVVNFPADLRDRIAQLQRRELSPAMVYALGIAIGKILFPGVIREHLSRSLPRNAREPCPLRICIRCDGFPLETIPWEYAYLADSADGPHSPSGYVVLSSDTSMVRYQILDRPSRAFTALNGRPLRIVAALSAPNGAGGLNLAKEKENIEQSLFKLGTKASRVYLDRVTPKAFNTALAEQPTDIVHFAGHGAYVQSEDEFAIDGQGNLIFEDDDGEIRYYPSEHLAMDMGDKNIRLVVLSACQSAMANMENAWAGVAPALVREGIPAVVGMQFSVQDKAAIEFGELFYSSLASGLTIDEAVAEGRKGIARECPNAHDFGVPVLYLRCSADSDAVLFPAPVPAPLPAVAVVNELPPLDLALVLRQIAQLGDYKQLHDALDKSRMSGLYLMHESIDDFPGLPRTVRAFKSYVARFRSYLPAMEEVAKRGQCESNLVEALNDDFRATLVGLDDAIEAGDKETLTVALGEFESLIAHNLDRINAKMTSAAGSLNLDNLVRFLRSTLSKGMAPGRADGALDELTRLSGALKEKVALHNAFQVIDNKLTLIRRKQPNEYPELVKHWTLLSKRIVDLQPNWSAAASTEWTDVLERMTSAVVDADARRGQDEFISFCSILQTGFSNIDTDLLRICGEVQARAAESIANLHH